MAARDSVFQTFVPTTSIAAPAEVRRLGSFSRLDLRDGEAAGYVGNGAKGCVWGVGMGRRKGELNPAQRRLKSYYTDQTLFSIVCKDDLVRT